MSLRPVQRRLRPWQRVGVALVALIALYLVGGYLLAPGLLKASLQKRLGAAFDRPASIGALSFDPFSLEFDITDIRVQRREPPRTPKPASSEIARGKVKGAGEAPEPAQLLRIDRIAGSLSWRSLLRFAPIVERLRMTSPIVAVVRDRNGRLDVDDLLERWRRQGPNRLRAGRGQDPRPAVAGRVGEPAQPASSPPEASATDAAMPAATPMRFSIANIEIVDGRFRFLDQQLGQAHTIDSVHLKIPFLSNLSVDQRIDVAPELQARIDGAPFVAAGQTMPFGPTRTTSLTFDLGQTDLLPYLAYLPIDLPLRVLSASAGTRIKLSFDQAPGASPTLRVTGRLDLVDVEIREPDGAPLLSVPAGRVELLDVDPLAGRYRLGEIVLDRPLLSLRRRAAHSRWLEALRPSPGASRAQAGTRWSVERLQMRDGRLELTDEALGDQPLKVQGESLSLTLGPVSNAPDVPTPFDVSVRTADGERFSAKGEALAEPMLVEAKVEAAGVKLPNWTALVQRFARIGFGAGRLEAGGAIRITPDPARIGELNIGLHDWSATVSDARLDQAWDSKPLIEVGAADIVGLEANLSAREFGLEMLRVTGGRMRLARVADGTNLGRAFAGPAVVVPGPQAPSAPAPLPPDWNYRIVQAQLQDFALEFDDRVVAGGAAISLEQLRLSLDDFSNRPGVNTRIGVAFASKAGGDVHANGVADLSRETGSLNIEAERLDLAPFGAYLLDALGTGGLRIGTGTLGARGSLRIEPGPTPSAPEGAAATGDGGGRPASSLSWKGAAQLGAVSILRLSDAAPVLAWQALDAEGLEWDAAGLATTRLEIKSPDLHLRRASDGRLELDRDDAPRAGTAEPNVPPTREKAPRLRAGALRIVDGRLEIADGAVSPPVRLVLQRIGVELDSEAPDAGARLRATGELARGGELSIEGSVDLRDQARRADLRLGYSDIAIAPLSAYAKALIGRSIVSGSLTGETRVGIESSRLQSQSKLTLGSLGLGERVEGQATADLPVAFALSLLQGRDGKLDIELPVDAALDDGRPFPVRDALAKALGDMISRTASEPFRKLAESLGGGLDPRVEFSAGSATLPANALDGLDALAQALAGRPALRLELVGHADPDADRKALARDQLRRVLEATLAEGADASALKTLEGEAYARLLAAAYDRLQMPKPIGRDGRARQPTVGEMEQALLLTLPVGDSQLRELATRRARAVRDRLAGSSGLGDARLSIGDASIDAADPAGGRRVDLRLRAG